MIDNIYLPLIEKEAGLFIEVGIMGEIEVLNGHFINVFPLCGFVLHRLCVILLPAGRAAAHNQTIGFALFPSLVHNFRVH